VELKVRTYDRRKAVLGRTRRVTDHIGAPVLIYRDRSSHGSRAAHEAEILQSDTIWRNFGGERAFVILRPEQHRANPLRESASIGKKSLADYIGRPIAAHRDADALLGSVATDIAAIHHS
jgi:hypothetical protein